jgi:hypothetical protein
MGHPMNLTFPNRHLNDWDGATVEIIDEDNLDSVVGEVQLEKGVRRHIVLFGRYKGTFHTHEESVAFVKDVEAVLEYMIG